MQAMIEPELLRSFLAIVETGSFTTAAERVLRTQSAVSMQMKRLEDQLGCRLFRKDGRGAVLTSDGERLVPYAERLLRAHREVLEAFRSGALDGSLRVGAPDDYASTFLPPILARFAETHPRVEVEMVVDTSSRLLARLGSSDGPDLALVSQGSGERDARRVHEAPLVWVGARHRDAHLQRPIPLALYGAGCSFRAAALQALASVGLESRIAYSSVSIAGIKAAVSAGLAIGVFLQSTVDESLRTLTLCDGLPAIGSSSIMLVRSSAASPTLDAMQSHIVETLAGKPRLVAA